MLLCFILGNHSLKSSQYSSEMRSTYKSLLSFHALYIGIILLAFDAGMVTSNDDVFVAMDQIEQINRNASESVTCNYLLSALFR